jgi:hypothetical protein
MKLIEKAKEILITIIKTRQIDLGEPVIIYPLKYREVVGNFDDKSYALLKGKEFAIQCEVFGFKGQAFTDTPSNFDGQIQDIIELTLENSTDRARFIAFLNALLRYLGLTKISLHCKDESPALCGPIIAKTLIEKSGKSRIALIGYQPSIAKSLISNFFCENVRISDLNTDNIGTKVIDVEIEDGGSSLQILADWCDIGLVTGSTIVNGSIDEIYQAFSLQNKHIIFFGNTIAGVASLLKLNHLCPYGL